MKLTAEQIVGRGYRFAHPLDQNRVPEGLKLASPASIKLQSRGPYSDHRIGASLYLHSLEIRTSFTGEKGRVNIPVSTPAFIEDAAAIRRWVTATARRLMGGAEPCSVYRVGSELRFQFSSRPEQDFADLAGRFPKVGPDEFSRDLIFYRSKQTRDLPLLDAWLTYQILEQAAGFRDIYQTSLSPSLSYKFVFKGLKELNHQRRRWKLPVLTLRPAFTEIESAAKGLTRETKIWPSLAQVAEALHLSSYHLEIHLATINQARISAGQVPLFLA